MAIWDSSLDIRRPIQPTWPQGMAIADLPAENSAEAGVALTHFGANVRVEPVRWDPSGARLLLRVGKVGAALWELESSRLVPAPGFDPLFTWITLEPLSYGAIAFYRDPATLTLARRIQAEGDPLRWVANPGPRQTRFLVFRPGQRLELRGYENGRSWNTHVPLAFADRPLLPANSKKPTFLGDQTGSRHFLPYARPVIDQVTGRVVGRFGLERIELENGRRIDLQRVFHGLTTVTDASANRDSIFALVDLAHQKRIARIRGHRIESWRLCEKSGLRLGPVTLPPDDALPPNIEVMREKVFFGSGKGRPFGLLYRPRRADGRLVVWMHGGPTATLADQTVPREVYKLAPLGISVLAVEQSGMLGGGLELTRRLPRLGHAALVQDMRSVAGWARRSGYRRVFLIADSFGGASGVIAAVDHPDVYEHIFLRAPMLALRAPEKSVRGRAIDILGETAPSPGRQREFEEIVLGGRERFAAALKRWTARLRPSPRLSFYFGDFDPVSAADDLPAVFAGHPSVKVVGGSHETTAGSGKVQRDIVAKLQRAN
ncbi:MAG TPA: hypothetical protein VF547_11590 [Allosphingosinicella sp.]